MLLTLGKASIGDYGEESLVARLLLGLVFNEYSVINLPDARGFRAFARRCLGIDASANDLQRWTATVEFQSNRCGTGGDATTFDGLLTLETDWVWGIEAKYYDFLKREQIEREAHTVQCLADKLGYARAGLLFLVPEQQLGTVVFENREIRGCLARMMRNGTPCVRVSSWEIVSEVIADAGTPELRHQLGAYWKLRNENKRYAAKVGEVAQVRDCAEWESRILDDEHTPSGLPRLLDSGVSSFSRFGQASAEVSEVFADANLALAEEIVRRARGFGFEPKGQQSGYVNLSRSGRAHAQIHPHPDGIVVVIRKADSGLPTLEVLQSVPYQNLRGYTRKNKSWLDQHAGAAVLIPDVLGENLEHVGWKDVSTLFGYARQN